MNKSKYIMGIDEAGRGPLAGPITVGATLIPRNLKISNITKLRDSKKLTQKGREKWFAYIKSHPQIFFASASVSAKMIDKIGIQKATARALSRAVATLIRTYEVRMNIPYIKHRVFNIREVEVLLDGSLYAPKKYGNQKTIIKGDEKIPAISLASIVAKVTRDKKMVKMAKEYPKYGFEIHKGYGTKKHIEAIKKNGLCEVHRRTYLKNYIQESNATQSTNPVY